MHHIHRILSQGRDKILRHWEQTPSMPWTVNPPRQWDHLPQLVEALGDAALIEPATSALVHSMIETALEHGRSRREEGADIEDVFDDYYRLRAAMWDYLQDCRTPAGDAQRAVLRIDMAITTATGISLLGYHEAEADRAPDKLRAAVVRLEHDLVVSMTRRASGNPSR